MHAAIGNTKRKRKASKIPDDEKCSQAEAKLQRPKRKGMFTHFVPTFIQGIRIDIIISA